MRYEITERKRYEERIREQAELLDKAQDAIIVRELQGGTIQYWNKGAERVYGWTAEESIGQTARELGLLTEANEQQFAEAQQRLLAQGEWAGEVHQQITQSEELMIE